MIHPFAEKGVSICQGTCSTSHAGADVHGEHRYGQCGSTGREQGFPHHQRRTEAGYHQEKIGDL